MGRESKREMGVEGEGEKMCEKKRKRKDRGQFFFFFFLAPCLNYLSHLSIDHHILRLPNRKFKFFQSSLI